MKTLHRRAAAALLLAASAASGQAAAEETGFLLDELIRQQVFQELKANVEHLYRNSVAETRKAAGRIEVHGLDNTAAPLAEDAERALKNVAREGRIGSGIAL